MHAAMWALSGYWTITRKFKRHKTPGPDEIPTEAPKEMNDQNLNVILGIINEWWEHEQIPDEAMNARVVLIYKKGDASLCENYRPISLLNTCYKLIAAAIQRRIEAGIDHLLQRTQYGFRKNRSTREALYNIRRVITAGESTKTKTFLLLLDWAKAFDTIDHEGLISTLERLNVAPKLINLIKDIYKKATFFRCHFGSSLWLGRWRASEEVVLR